MGGSFLVFLFVAVEVVFLAQVKLAFSFGFKSSGAPVVWFQQQSLFRATASRMTMEPTIAAVPTTAAATTTVVVLLCGLPGSGKSTLAQWLVAECQNETTEVIHIEYDAVEESLHHHGNNDQGDDAHSSSSSADYTREIWKQTRSESLEIFAKRLQETSTRPLRIILMDDNFHLRSMRREVYRICQRQVASSLEENATTCPYYFFAVLWLDISPDVCLQRNQQRLRRIPKEVVEKMKETLEPPGKEIWEQCFLQITNEHNGNGTGNGNMIVGNNKNKMVKGFVTTRCQELYDPVPPPPPPVDLEQLEEERRKTKESWLHNWDQQLRKWVGHVAQISRRDTGNANKARKQLLQRLRREQEESVEPDQLPSVAQITEWFLAEIMGSGTQWSKEQMDQFRLATQETKEAEPTPPIHNEIPSDNSIQLSTLDSVAEDLLSQGGVALLPMTNENQQVFAKGFQCARHALESVSTLTVRCIGSTEDSAHATGYHPAAASNSMSRYNGHREGFVFSDGSMFGIQTSESDEATTTTMSSSNEASFEPCMKGMQRCLHTTANQVLTAIEKQLQLPDYWFQENLEYDGDYSQWHLKRYVYDSEPPAYTASSEGDEDTILLPSHTDPSLLSVVVLDQPGIQAGGMGLQVYQQVSGQDQRVWTELPQHGHGVAIIFVGSVLSYMTGNIYPSPRHRVIRKDTVKDRMAATFFLRPKGSALLQVPPSSSLKDVTLKKKQDFDTWSSRVSRNYMKQKS